VPRIKLGPGYHLLRDPDDPEREWALWQGCGDHIFVHVAWSGSRPPDAARARMTNEVYNPGRFTFYELTDEQADVVVMASLHLRSEPAWNRYCCRLTTGMTPYRRAITKRQVT
jgi:hypothetical protein